MNEMTHKFKYIDNNLRFQLDNYILKYGIEYNTHSDVDSKG